MNEQENRALLVKDSDGHYYAIPHQVMREHQVPDHQIDLAEEAAANADDVSGFNFYFVNTTTGTGTFTKSW